MMKLIFATLLIITSFNVSAQPPSADAIMTEAKKEAARENKNVFVLFHASWCIWCHRMDTAMNEPALKPLFDKNYVIKHLTVLENPANKKMENPGAEEMLKEYKGMTEGIPYWLIFDKNGKLLANSRITKADGTKGGNVGCPAQDDEVAYFISVLKNTSSLNPEQLDVIRKRFLKINQH